MALAGAENWSRGFVFADAAGTQLAHTQVLTGATMQNGLLRDPDGRLVTDLVGPGSYDQGFLRAASGALLVTANQSTPKLYMFA